MTSPDNTEAHARTPHGAASFLAESMLHGSESAIYQQEAEGQRQLVTSQVLPYGMWGKDNRVELEALGITVGDPVPDDELFRYVTLPDGWNRRATDHSMWSEIVDTHGRPRARVFYKAVFYDRKAHAHVVDLPDYIHRCAADREPVIFDDEWATPRRVLNAAEAAQMEAVDEVKHRRDLDLTPDDIDRKQGEANALSDIRDAAARHLGGQHA